MHKFIQQFIAAVGVRVAKSVGKAYQQTIRNRGGAGNKAGNPFAQKFQQVFVNSSVSTPMSKEEALNILNYEEKDIDPQKVMQRYFTLMERNREGGSLYLQAKVVSAKKMLMEGHEEVEAKLEKEWQEKNNKDSEQQAEQAEQQKEQQKRGSKDKQQSETLKEQKREEQDKGKEGSKDEKK